MYSIGEVSRMAGVTVRTLHHYDEVGLLRPAARSGSGHREYQDADVARLQQILFYRELGFSLENIADLLEEHADAGAHFRRQRVVIAVRLQRLQEMYAAVEEALGAHVVGAQLSAEERLAVFGRWRPPTGYTDAAELRWGGTRPWRQGRERMARYSAEDLAAMQRETDGWVERLSALMASGAPPDGSAAMDLMEEHRLAVGRWWFDCDHAMHRELGRLCATDPDQLAFLVRPERQVPGMGAYLRDATEANARRG